MKAYQIIDKLNTWAMPELIDSWDNTGFQIGNDEKIVENILISLDLDNQAIEYAVKNNIDMIITHHPIIFSPLKEITNKSYIGNIILKCIKNDIVVYNGHSNLDLAVGGVNDELSDIFCLKNVQPIEVNKIDKENNVYGYGRVGDVEDFKIKDFLELVKAKLAVDYIKVYGDLSDRIIKRVAVLGGSGASFIKSAKEKKADIIITSDIKYHDAQLSEQLDIVIVDAGHFHTEKVILPKIRTFILKHIDSSLDIHILNKPGLNEVIY